MNMMRKLIVIMLISLIVIPPGNINFVYAVSEVNTASEDDGPTLEVYQSGDNVKAEWAVEMLDEDVIYETGFEMGEQLPALTFHAGSGPRRNGGQSITTEDKFSGNRSFKAEDTHTFSNYDNAGADGSSNWANYSVAKLEGRTYIESGADLSLSFRAKTTGEGNFRFRSLGQTADSGEPINVKFLQDVKPGDKVVKVDNPRFFKSYLDRNARYYIANQKGRYSYIFIESIDEANSTITVSGNGFRGEFKSGDNLLRHVNVLAVSFQSRDIDSDDGWRLFNMNTKVSNFSNFDVAQRGFEVLMQSTTGDILYVDDIKMGYATETELYRDGNLVYKGKLSDYEDKTATDVTKPNMVSNYSFQILGENRTMQITEPKDNGTTYNYELKAISKDELTEYSSGIKPVTVTSGIAGYSYIINSSSTGTPNGTINSTGEISIPTSAKTTDYLHIKTVDNAGNLSDTQSYRISTLQSGLPSMSMTVNGSDEYSQRYSTIVAASPSGDIVSFQYAWTTSSTFPTSGFEDVELSGESTRAPIRSPEGVTGTYYLHLKAERSNGNARGITSQPFLIDNTAPTLSLSQDIQNWTNDPIKLTAFGTDQHSGIEGVSTLAGDNIRGVNMLSVDDIKTWHGTTHQRIGNRYIFDEEPGTFRGGIYYDGTHVERGKNYVFSFDIEILEGDMPYLGGHLNVSDNVEIYIDGEKAIQLEEDRNQVPATNDWHRGVYFPNDRNKHHVTIKFKVNDELTTLDQRIFIQANRLMYFEEHSYLVEVSNIQLEEGDEETPYEQNIRDATTEGNPLEYTAYSNGTYSFMAFDKAGNSTEKSIEITNIDTKTPTMTITPDKTYNTHEDIELAVNASDDLSGVKRIKTPDGKWSTQANLTYTATQNGVYEFLVEDNAGNTFTANYEVNNIVRVLSLEGPEIDSNLNIEISEDMELETDIGDIIVTDWRDNHSDWRLLLKADRLTNGNQTLPKGVISTKGIQSIDKLDSGNRNPWFTYIDTDTIIDDGQVEMILAISDEGVSKVNFREKALNFRLPADKVRKGVYTTRLVWTLEAAAVIQ